MRRTAEKGARSEGRHAALPFGRGRKWRGQASRAADGRTSPHFGRGKGYHFGDGAVDFPATPAALRAENYEGFISLEDVFKKPEVARKNAENYLAFMRAELAKRRI